MAGEIAKILEAGGAGTRADLETALKTALPEVEKTGTVTQNNQISIQVQQNQAPLQINTLEELQNALGRDEVRNALSDENNKIEQIIRSYPGQRLKIGDGPEITIPSTVTPENVTRFKTDAGLTGEVD